MNITLELAKGRIKGGRYFSLFLYPPPRGDYFVIYDENQTEVHRFKSYFPIAKVLKLTQDKNAPKITMQKLSRFKDVEEYLK
jgi:hypothetical protein